MAEKINISLGIIGKVGLKSYLEDVVGIENIVDIKKWTITSKGTISVSYYLRNGKKGCTFISIAKFKGNEIKRMVERVKEVTNEKLSEYNTELNFGKASCECCAYKYQYYKVNNVVICKHLVKKAKTDTLIREIGTLSKYIKGIKG